MEYNVLSSLALCKQKRRGRLNERNSKRRALTNIRRNLLDTTHSEVCAASSNTLNTQVDNSFKNLSCSNSNNVNSNHCQIYKLQNLHSFDNMPELSFNETASDNISEVSIYEQENNESDEYFDLSTFFNHPDISLHDSTNVTKAEYCRNLLTLFRDANVCKTHCDRFIRLIYSGLPTPNNLPKSMKNLLNDMQGKIERTENILSFRKKMKHE
ncbi:unnamed protein product [Rotaria sp. Silwood1]|nr:unnamed protein product [Rotaria sp. Silwood1]